MSGKRTEKVHIKPKTLRRAILTAVSVILLILTLTAKAVTAKSLPSQLAADRWQAGELRYTQVSCFISEDVMFGDSMLAALRGNVDQALEAEAITSETEGARLWLDAYSGEATLTLSREGKSSEARAICVGGDFFFFHELEMMDGWYFSENDVMQDSVVIDRELAWQLFGAFELAGMRIEINGFPCIVSGVSRTPADGAEGETYGTKPTVYLPSALAEKLGLSIPVTCYEAVLPDPVTDFGANIIKTALALGDGDATVVENTCRYSFSNSVKSVADFAFASTRTDTINYPYWENAAIYNANWCRLLTFLTLLFAIYPAVILCMLFVLLIKRRRLVFKKTVAFVKKVTAKNKSRDERQEPINMEEQK